jgi:hypothetical protein
MLLLQSIKAIDANRGSSGPGFAGEICVTGATMSRG